MEKLIEFKKKNLKNIRLNKIINVLNTIVLVLLPIFGILKITTFKDSIYTNMLNNMYLIYVSTIILIRQIIRHKKTNLTGYIYKISWLLLTIELVFSNVSSYFSYLFKDNIYNNYRNEFMSLFMFIQTYILAKIVLKRRGQDLLKMILSSFAEIIISFNISTVIYYLVKKINFDANFEYIGTLLGIQMLYFVFLVVLSKRKEKLLVDPKTKQKYIKEHSYKTNIFSYLIILASTTLCVLNNINLGIQIPIILLGLLTLGFTQVLLDRNEGRRFKLNTYIIKGFKILLGIVIAITLANTISSNLVLSAKKIITSNLQSKIYISYIVVLILTTILIIKKIVDNKVKKVNNLSSNLSTNLNTNLNIYILDILSIITAFVFEYINYLKLDLPIYIYVSRISILVVLAYIIIDMIRSKRDFINNPVNSQSKISIKDRIVYENGKKLTLSEKRKKVKVLFGITGLTIGGAERVLVDLVKEIQDIYDITIFTIYAGGELEKELVGSKVKLITMFKKPLYSYSKIMQKLVLASFMLFNKLVYSFKIKNIYDVEIAFLEGPITRMFSNTSNAKKIVWVHNDIQKVYETGNNAKAKIKLDKELYNNYDKIVFVSNDNKQIFEKFFKDNIVPKEVIYNYVDSKRILKRSKEQLASEIIENIPSIVTVARLVEAKAIFRYLEVHKKLIDEGIVHNIYIIGDGPQKEELNNKINEYGLKKSFNLIGKKENPYPYILKGDYFALFSHFEGYGIVLDEAKVLNKPILLTNTAAREAANGYSKALIFENNENAIYEGLKEVLTNNKLLKNNKNNKNNKNSIKHLDFTSLNKNKVYNVINLIEE